MVTLGTRFEQGLEGLFPGIRDLTKIHCRIGENVDGMPDLTATREAEFAKILNTNADWERKLYSG